MKFHAKKSEPLQYYAQFVADIEKVAFRGFPKDILKIKKDFLQSMTAQKEKADAFSGVGLIQRNKNPLSL